MAHTVRRGVDVPMEANVTSGLALASVSRDTWDPTAAPVVPQVAMGETVLRCVCVERKDSATQRLGGVTAHRVERDLPANKYVLGGAMERNVGISVRVRMEACVTL